MSKLLSRWATPLISALFAISLVSGVSIFFGLGRAYFNEMHEWLSLLLIVPFALHLWRHWRPFLNYVRNRSMISDSAATLVAAVAFAAPGLLGGDRADAHEPDRAGGVTARRNGGGIAQRAGKRGLRHFIDGSVHRRNRGRFAEAGLGSPCRGALLEKVDAIWRPTSSFGHATSFPRPDSHTGVWPAP